VSAQIPVTRPRDALELQLLRIFGDLLDYRPIGVDTDFFNAGGDSILAMTLLARIVQETGYRLPISGLMRASTVGRLAEVLRESNDSAAWSPIVPLQTEGSQRPFYCVHPAGGNALCYLQLSHYIGNDQPFYGLQAPGIDGILEPVSSIEEMAEQYVAAVRQAQPQGPYALGGWSLGGIVAYEMAQQLQADGEEVASLALIDSGLLYAFAVMLTFFRDDDRDMWERLRSPDADQVAFFRERTAPAQLIPEQADDRLAGQIYRVVVANMRALLNYRLRPYTGRLLVFQAREKYIHAKHQPHDEWRRLCESVELETTGGNHLTLIHDPHVGELAEKLGAYLRR
jgi:pyochelin synthetase